MSCSRIYLVFLIFSGYLLLSQDTATSVCFDFNQHNFLEKDNKVQVKPVGVTLTDDRFGNKQSAVYIHGHNSSYLNLGTSSLLKPRSGTVSFWVNVDRRVFSGKGYPNNPFIITKNSETDDFCNALLM
jgi:hypothetical protein